MRTIPFTEFRANCHALIKSVYQTRDPIRITRCGKPLVEIRPIPVGAAEKACRRAEREARDLEILNQYAEELNAQALDGLEDQSDILDCPNNAALVRQQKRREAVRPLAERIRY